MKLPGQEGVVVTSGRRLSHAIGICISAPLDIKILRERLYLKAQEGVLPDRPRRPNRHYAKAMGCRCRGIMKLKMHDGVWVDCPAAQDQALPICYPIE